MRIGTKTTETIIGVTLTLEEAEAVFKLVGTTSEGSRKATHDLSSKQAKILGTMYTEYDHAKLRT